MLDTLYQPAVVIGDQSVTLAQVVRPMHQRGGLLRWLRDAAIEELLLRKCAALGLRVGAEELQRAADLFRRRSGMLSAQQTHAWLGKNFLAVQDLEAALERDLLIAKLKDHVLSERVADHFAAHGQGYARAQLRQILVSRDDLAQELLAQIRDDGRDFAALAREHSQDAARSRGGSLGVVLRRQLLPEVAEAVFAARPGDIVGPLATPQGFHLVLVEELRPAELNAATAAVIRQELFGQWLQEQLKDLPIAFPLLDAL